MPDCTNLKVGDFAVRDFCGIKQRGKVTAVDETTLMFQGMWTFDRKTGAEEDEDLQWGVKYGRTGSTLYPE